MIDNGSISPCDDTGLAFGIGEFPLLLVPRNSPNRLIFKHGKSLCKKRKQHAGRETCEEKGFPLELSSHPGCSIKFRTEWSFNLGIAVYHPMILGSVEKATCVSYDGRIIESCKDGAVLNVMDKEKWLYNVGAPVFFSLAKSKKMTRWKGGVNDFVINEEGSISPMHARNRALGCAFLGMANSIITQAEKEIAEKETKSKTISRAMLHKYWNLRLDVGMLQYFDLSSLRGDPNKT